MGVRASIENINNNAKPVKKIHIVSLDDDCGRFRLGSYKGQACAEGISLATAICRRRSQEHVPQPDKSLESASADGATARESLRFINRAKG